MTKIFNFVDGEVLLVDKPYTWTSFDVVRKLRNLVSKFAQNKKRLKVGHAGTLDPLATGLLIVCTGPFTKRIEEFQAKEKEYTGEFYLGQTRPSYDRETEVNQEFSIDHLQEADIVQATQAFLGNIEQFPPMHSAVKVDGKRLYKHARAGEAVEVKARPVHISEFEITEIALPLVHFRVVCSKGTYIRSLAQDFGKALQAGAYLHNLRRTRIGEFKVSEAYEMQDLIDRIREQLAETKP